MKNSSDTIETLFSTYIYQSLLHIPYLKRKRHIFYNVHLPFLFCFIVICLTTNSVFHTVCRNYMCAVPCASYEGMGGSGGNILPFFSYLSTRWR
jgi:hypothetical protein